MNNVLVWLAIGIIFFVLFTKTHVSNYSGTNTLFDLNELSWIPTQVRTALKDGIHDKIIPAMTKAAELTWNKTPVGTQDEIITYITQACDSISKEIETQSKNITFSTKDRKSPSPSS